MVPWPAKGFRGAHEEEEKKEEEKKEEDGREWDDERWRGVRRRCRLGCAGAAADGAGIGGSAVAGRTSSLRLRIRIRQADPAEDGLGSRRVFNFGPILLEFPRSSPRFP